MYNLDIKLNEAQRQAVECTDGQILVLAGAGSGKTRVLTARIAYLVKQCGVSPYEILAITFTNKAAKEMLNRIEDILDGRTDVWASTFHSFCAKILRYNAGCMGYTSSFTIYDEQDSTRVIKRICAARGIEDSKLKDRIIEGIFQAKCFNLGPAAFGQDYAALRDIDKICEVYEAYEAELYASNAMDFDDLLIKTVELFVSHPEVLAKYQQRFRYIHVDEFQDTNATQYTLIKLLAGVHGNIFVVGDEDQSIYSWRGAEIKNILNFKKDFKDAIIFKLEQNYRSTNSILKAANRVIAENKQRIGEKNLWTDNAGGDPVNVCNVSSDREEADFVVREIANLVRQGYSNRDIAILSRVNALTRPFEERLNLYGIAYKVYGGFKFYERKEVKDVVAYLRIAANPRDNEAILRVINFPKRGIGDSPVTELLNYCADRHEDLIDALLGVESNSFLTAATKKKLTPFKDIVGELIKRAATMEMTEFVRHTLKVSGIENYYATAKDEDADRYENILELVNAVRDFAKDNPSANIDDFLQSVTLISETDTIQDDDYITLATVHAVKGLEFPVVFIIAAEEGIFPLQRSVENNELEEERRLMYVAITRAKRKLYVTSAQRRFRFNTVMYNVRSRFVGEMTGKPQASPKQKERDMEYSPRPQLPRTEYKPNTQTTRESFGEGKVILADFSGFTVGRDVIHKKFGRGTIVQTFGDGVDKAALINFEGIGTKKFLLLIANLQLVER